MPEPTPRNLIPRRTARPMTAFFVVPSAAAVALADRPVAARRVSSRSLSGVHGEVYPLRLVIDLLELLVLQLDRDRRLGLQDAGAQLVVRQVGHVEPAHEHDLALDADARVAQ